MQMTFNDLRIKVETVGRGKHFFSRDNLTFFGERLSGMHVLRNTTIVTDVNNEKHTCYVVSSICRKYAFSKCKPYTFHHYFDSTSFQHILLYRGGGNV